MTQTERLEYLIQALMLEQHRHSGIALPSNIHEKEQLLRALFNVRPPEPVGSEFLRIQDDYLREETRSKGITDIGSLRPVSDMLFLWQGDITTLMADAIVNAANSQMLGCFVPCHGCIDNAIHTYAGVQLRLECADLMKKQGHEERTGRAKLTKAYNLPSRYVIHTVGPIIMGALTQADCDLLASCYRTSLRIAMERGLSSIAFCCISTGEFRFPPDRAARIAVQTVKEYLREHPSKIKVVFNVFKERDYELYERILAGH